MDILKRQRQLAEQARIAREATEAKKAALVAANPKPPKFPAGPMPNTTSGIAFGPRRTVKQLAGRKRKTAKTKRVRRSKK